RRRPSSSPTTTGGPRPSRSRKPGGRSWPHERRLDGAQQGAEAPALPVPGAGMSVFEQHKLGNGLRILSANMPQVPSVTCMNMLRNSKFESAEIEREKGVIVEEMNMYYDTPRDFIGGLYERLLYGDQPLGWDIIGRKETIRGATRETFLDYIGRWYKPERMIVGVAGKLDDGYLGSIEGLLGDLEPEETGAPPPTEPEANGRPQVTIHKKESDQAHLCLGVPSYPTVHPDRWALQMLSTVLGTGMSSRLFTEVREKRGLAYYVYAHNQGYTDAGSLYSQAGVDIARSEEAVETIVREFRRLVDEPVPADELEKARALAKGRLVLRLE